jgi:hypothetical protein
MFTSRNADHRRYASFAALAGAPALSAFVLLWWPWLVLTGTAQLPFLTDTNVTYSAFCLTPKTGQFDIIKITGQFPHARYFSFMVYGGSRSQPFDALTDYAMKPDPGSINPFVPFPSPADPTAVHRSYTVYAIMEGSGIDPSSYDNVLIIPRSEDFINILMRIYRPDDGLDYLAGVPLPTVEVGRASGPVRVPGYGLGSDVFALIKMFFGVHYQVAEIYDRLHDDSAIEFYHLSREGGLPNTDVPYLDTALGATESGSDARLAVLRFRPPTFDDTHAGRGTATGTNNVRYYSFCTSDIATGYNNQCVSDTELKIDADGLVTLVVYPPVLEERVKRSGLNHLVRGYSATTSLTYRQLLPASDFAGAASRVPLVPVPLGPDVNVRYYAASGYIGDYAPTGTYYTGGEFEAWLHRRARLEQSR